MDPTGGPAVGLPTDCVVSASEDSTAKVGRFRVQGVDSSTSSTDPQPVVGKTDDTISPKGNASPNGENVTVNADTKTQPAGDAVTVAGKESRFRLKRVASETLPKNSDQPVANDPVDEVVDSNSSRSVDEPEVTLAVTVAAEASGEIATRRTSAPRSVPGTRFAVVKMEEPVHTSTPSKTESGSSNLVLASPGDKLVRVEDDQSKSPTSKINKNVSFCTPSHDDTQGSIDAPLNESNRDLVEQRGRYRVTNNLNLSEIPDEPYELSAKTELLDLDDHIYTFTVYERKWDPLAAKNEGACENASILEEVEDEDQVTDSVDSTPGDEVHDLIESVQSDPDSTTVDGDTSELQQDTSMPLMPVVDGADPVYGGRHWDNEATDRQSKIPDNGFDDANGYISDSQYLSDSQYASDSQLTSEATDDSGLIAPTTVVPIPVHGSAANSENSGQNSLAFDGEYVNSEADLDQTVMNEALEQAQPMTIEDQSWQPVQHGSVYERLITVQNEKMQQMQKEILNSISHIERFCGTTQLLDMSNQNQELKKQVAELKKNNESLSEQLRLKTEECELLKSHRTPPSTNGGSTLVKQQQQQQQQQQQLKQQPTHSTSDAAAAYLGGAALISQASQNMQDPKAAQMPAGSVPPGVSVVNNGKNVQLGGNQPTLHNVNQNNGNAMTNQIFSQQFMNQLGEVGAPLSNPVVLNAAANLFPDNQSHSTPPAQRRNSNNPLADKNWAGSSS